MSPTEYTSMRSIDGKGVAHDDYEECVQCGARMPWDEKARTKHLATHATPAMTDTTAPRTAAGRELLDDIRDLRTQAEANPEPGVGWWLNEARISVEEELPAIEAEAIEPLLALVRAAQEAFVAAEFPHGTDMSTWSKDEVERFWIDADTRWMEARRTFLTLYVALPESVRVAARKPE